MHTSSYATFVLHNRIVAKNHRISKKLLEFCTWGSQYAYRRELLTKIAHRDSRIDTEVVRLLLFYGDKQLNGLWVRAFEDVNNLTGSPLGKIGKIYSPGNF